jgi:hypothetical protein
MLERASDVFSNIAALPTCSERSTDISDELAYTRQPNLVHERHAISGNEGHGIAVNAGYRSSCIDG